MPGDLEQQLISEVAADGPMRFELFVERALYDPDLGFYAVGGQAGGRGGDFVTSVEVGPLFGAIVSDWLDGVWSELGRPEEFRVAEVGAGAGTLFRSINRAEPDCFQALTYTLVERSASLRASHESLPSDAWRSAANLPEHQHVILANELLDNLPFGIAERIADGWAPVQVAVDGEELGLFATDRDPSLDHLAGLAPTALPGARVPLATAARDWVRQSRVRAGRVLVFDYATTTAELVERGQDGWLRTYSGHVRGSDPLAEIGQCDITYDVPIDQLPQPSSRYKQAEWLMANGLSDRVQAARDLWTDRGHIGDLQAIAARSAISEAEALTDPAGLGGFVVLEWRS